MLAFLECEKKDNNTWTLEVCQKLLKDQENMTHVIVTDHDTVLMNLVENLFPISYDLLCRYHVTKNVRVRLKSTVGTKQVNGEDGKMVKPNKILESIMHVYNIILNSSIEKVISRICYMVQKEVHEISRFCVICRKHYIRLSKGENYLCIDWSC